MACRDFPAMRASSSIPIARSVRSACFWSPVCLFLLMLVSMCVAIHATLARGTRHSTYSIWIGIAL